MLRYFPAWRWNNPRTGRRHAGDEKTSDEELMLQVVGRSLTETGSERERLLDDHL
jgi:hypothetical protein